MDEHVILVAFTVEAPTYQKAQRTLMESMPPLPATRVAYEGKVTEWWIAEDLRFDRSDNEAAVFVPYGLTTQEARQVLEWAVANKEDVLEAYAATQDKRRKQ